MEKGIKKSTKSKVEDVSTLDIKSSIVKASNIKGDVAGFVAKHFKKKDEASISTSDQKFEFLPISSIVDNPNNPRKHYNEIELQELAESIKGVGLVQPPTVRLVNDKYEIVAGSRRFRASVIAGLNAIPVIVKELTDDQALEISLIENLQRSDVHPMEESVAFRQLLDQHKSSIADIALRFGKSENFVRQRLKLNDLSDTAQELFYNSTFNLSDAIKIAQFDKGQQNEIITSAKMYTGGYNFTPHLFKKFNGLFSEAFFSMEDENLDPTMGACSNCQYNTANQLLFAEETVNPKCVNISCFASKSSKNFDNQLKEAIDDPSVIIINNHWNKSAFVESIGKERSGVFVDYNYFNIISEPELITIDEFKEDWEDNFDEDDDFDEEWIKVQEEYKLELAEHQSKLEYGNAVKAFIADGTNKGATVFISLKQNALQHQKDISETDPIASEIYGIKSREERAKELDGEKIQKRIGEAVKEITDFKKLKPDQDLLKVLLRFFIWQYSSYYSQGEIRKILKVKEGQLNEPEKLEKFLLDLTDDQLYIISAVIMKEKFSSHVSFKGEGSYFLRKFASVSNIPVDAFIQEQQEKAEKRQVRVNERIQALKKSEKVEA